MYGLGDAHKTLLQSSYAYRFIVKVSRQCSVVSSRHITMGLCMAPCGELCIINGLLAGADRGE